MLSPGLHPQPGFLAWGLETQAALSASVSSSEECSGADVRSWAHGADSASNPLPPSLWYRRGGALMGRSHHWGPPPHRTAAARAKGPSGEQCPSLLSFSGRGVVLMGCSALKGPGRCLRGAVLEGQAGCMMALG